MTQVFYHATSQALPQFPLLQNRPGDAFREDPRLPGTRWEPGLDDCKPPTSPRPRARLHPQRVPWPTPPLDPHHSPRAPASPSLAAPGTPAPYALRGARTLTGAQGGPEASAWAEKGEGPVRDSPAHRWAPWTNQRSLRPAPPPPLGLSPAQSKRAAGAPCQSEVGEACQAWEKNLAESARPLAGPGPDGQREAPIKRLGERPGAAG